MSEESEEHPYTLEECDGQFEIRLDTGRTILVCKDGMSAAHYLELLGDAFKIGYKRGVRSRGRQTSEEKI